MAVEDAVPIEGETLHRSSSGSPGMKKRNKLDIFNAVIQHLSDNKNIEISSDMEDSLWAHFKSLPTKYAMDVNVERAEDVLMHMKLLEEARDPAKCPSFSACVVQVHRTIDENTVENEAASNFLRTQKAPPPFGSSPNLEALDINNIEDTVRHSARAMHQITFSSDDKPKVLNQLTSILGELGLNIQEAHAFSTTDGLSLDIFVVIGWHYEEIEELKQALEKKIRRIKGPEMEEEELVQKSGNGHVEIRKDEKSDWEIDFNLLSVRNKIASGSYGDLYRGVYCSQDVAIKVIKAEQVNEDVQREFAHEVYIMRKIRHKNVVQFIGACTVPPKLCIVTEFMSGGSIYDYLHKENGFFKLPTLLRMAIDVSKGMSYLHENNIIHRDLKTANLLMDENKVVKVADFGVARVKAKSGVMTAETGTYRWMAPEVIEHKPYDHKADVFSFGIVLWEFLTGKVPYDDMQPLQAAIGVVRKSLRPTIPEETNPKLVELLNKCWQQDPTLRPDFSQILENLKCIAKEVGDDSHDHKTKSPRVFFPFRRNRNE